MRSFIIIPFLSSAALAAFNTRICDGAGGCVGTTWSVGDPFRCPDETRLNVQQTAGNSIDTGNGSYEIITKEEFPSSCLRGVKPADTDTLVLHHTEFGQKMYVFLAETCTETNPIADCYSANPNPSTTTICQLVDTTGKNCEMNPLAGECERWGTSAGREHCAGWTPDQVEEPSES
ncbi:hypothetical protein C7974DRAFT_390860 [Boeremia exigua]|uniref:uncharacterized protein n=1 Tax=Boeremia exigua TaxID=749465 RepID=UPI001E8D0C1F|nr:uncharacterized protein C7974DRAFT_390860 [Boeremia exigua]KAH6638093.1 hypothetical protein C7974DRAFT_390860 [Boeremia exigua]